MNQTSGSAGQNGESFILTAVRVAAAGAEAGGSVAMFAVNRRGHQCWISNDNNNNADFI